MLSFVLDCSVALTWCFADEASASSDALLHLLGDQSGTVPQVWHLEIGNLLTQAERRGRISAGDVTERIALLGRLALRTAEDGTRTAHR